MKTKLKKSLSFLLVFIMLIVQIPLGTITASAADGLSLAELKEKFPAGKYWNHYVNNTSEASDYLRLTSKSEKFANTVSSEQCALHGSASLSYYVGKYDCNYFDGGVQCFGFARKLGYDAFGTKVSTWATTTSTASVKAGDVIRYTGGGATGEHSVFVTGVSGSTITVGECNWGNNCVIRWGRTIKLSDISIVLRYIAPKELSGIDEHTHSYTGSYFEKAHPHNVYQKCSCGKIQYTGSTKAYSECSTCMKVSSSYVHPVKAYTINTGNTVVYNKVSGTAKSNKIYDTDLCTISEVYDCGWCKVTFPLDSGGTETGYVKISVFMKSAGYGCYTSKQFTTYSRSDLKTSIGKAASGDKIYILGNTSSAVQIAYPLSSGGYKVGWVPISSFSSTIKYNANGGTGTMSNQSVNYKSTLTLALNKFTRSGYAFSGWNVYRSSDKTWYVRGQGWKTASQISANDYEKATYKNGWSSDLGKSWIISGKTNDTFTFYPIWTANTLSVYYNANGGSVSSDTYKLSGNLIYTKNDNSKFVQTWTYNNKKTNGLVNFSTFGLSKTGYTFKGWGTSSSGGTIFDQYDVDLLPTSINSNIATGNCSKTLYAIWKPNTYSVKYNANGGTGAPASQTKTYGTNLTLSNTVPVKEGYTFKGWGTTGTATTAVYQPGGSYTANEAVTLYAIWSIDSYTVTYDANGGTDAPSAQTNTYGNTLTLSNTIPKRSGYVFNGWATTSNAEKAEYQPGGIYTAGKTVTLYAVWQIIGISQNKDYSYILSDDVIEITTYNGSETDLVIPAQIDGYNVVEITDRCFEKNSDLRTITFPNTVEKIGNYVCCGCSSLESVIIPQSVTSIGLYSFAECSPDFVIYGYANSYAEEYALQNGYKFIDVNAHIHSWNSEYTVDKAATCTQDGSKSIHCKTCDEVINITVIPAYDHTFEEVIVRESTCSSVGEKLSRCSSCGAETNKTEIPLNEHNFVLTTVTEATCLAEGLKEEVCSECLLHINPVAIPMLEHEFGQWEITKEATAQSDGIESRSCINCKTAEQRTVEYVYDENSPMIYLQGGTANIGGYVTVDIYLDNNPGITALRLMMEYDATALTMTDFSFGETFSSMNKGTSAEYDTPYSFSMYSATADLTDNGILATATFKVNDTAQSGEYSISLSYAADDIFNLDGEQVEFYVEDGTIIVNSYPLGDINSDGSINMRDIALLQQVINGWNVDYNSLTADFNQDKKINMRDIVALQRKING